MAMSPRTQTVLLKLVVWIGAGWPLAVGLYRWFLGDRLGADPVAWMTLTSGTAAIVLLIASLAVTPLRKLSGWNGVQKVRRLTGLWAFAYAAIHVAVYAVLDQGLAWSFILEDVTERRFTVVGALAFLLLMPLAVTSTRGWIRRLGKNWTRLHWLVYPASLLALLHYTWGQKADLRGPIVAGLILLPLLGFRIRSWLRKRADRKARENVRRSDGDLDGEPAGVT